MNQVRTKIINLLATGYTIEEVGAPDMLAEHFNVKKLLDLEFLVLREYNSVRDDLEQIAKYLAPALTAQDEVIRCLEFLSKKLLDYRKGESGNKSSRYPPSQGPRTPDTNPKAVKTRPRIEPKCSIPKQSPTNGADTANKVPKAKPIKAASKDHTMMPPPKGSR